MSNDAVTAANTATTGKCRCPGDEALHLALQFCQPAIDVHHQIGKLFDLARL